VLDLPGAGHLGLAALVDGHLSTVRTEFGRFGAPGVGLLLRAPGFRRSGRRLDRFLVGSEGTLAVVLEAEVTLVEDAPARALAVLGFPSMADAADAVPCC
jgi:FAD/FMN-containing dehydrogenase